MAVSLQVLFALFVLFGAIVCLRPILDPPSTQEDDFVLVDFRIVPRSFARSCYESVTRSSKRSYNACLAVLPTQIYTNFSFELPKGGKEFYIVLLLQQYTEFVFFFR